MFSILAPGPGCGRECSPLPGVPSAPSRLVLPAELLQGGALGAGSGSCSWWRSKRIGSVPGWLWVTRIELLQRRKQGMLAPSSSLCLTVPLSPSLGQRVCPEPTAELGPSDITAHPGVLWGEPRESTAPGNCPRQQPHFWAGQDDCWGNWGWVQGKGGSSQASSAPSSAGGSLWGAGQAAWPLPECPGTKTLAEEMEKTPEHQRGSGEP